MDLIISQINVEEEVKKASSRTSEATTSGIQRHTDSHSNTPSSSGAATTSQANGTRKIEGKKEKFFRCVRNILVVENEVGEKETRFRAIDKMLKNLRVKRDDIDKKNADLLSKIYDLEIKSPNLTMEEFKEMCFLKHNLKDNQQKRMEACEEIAFLIKESNNIKPKIIKNYDSFKMFAYMKKKLT